MDQNLTEWMGEQRWPLWLSLAVLALGAVVALAGRAGTRAAVVVAAAGLGGTLGVLVAPRSDTAQVVTASVAALLAAVAARWVLARRPQPERRTTQVG